MSNVNAAGKQMFLRALLRRDASKRRSANSARQPVQLKRAGNSLQVSRKPPFIDARLASIDAVSVLDGHDRVF
jgi:hypothetical protein